MSTPLRLPWDIQALIIEETISLAQVEAHTRFVVGNEGKKDDGHWVVYENLRLVSKDWKHISDALFFADLIVPSDSSFLRLFHHLSLSPSYQSQTHTLTIRSNGYWDLLSSSAQNLSPLLRLFPNLQRLSLGVTFYCVRPQRNFVIPECLQVQEEMVYLREYEGPMNALLGSEACSRLEKVNLTSTQDNQLIKLPPTVKELSVTLTLDYHIHNIPTSSTETPLPALESLTLSNLTPAILNSTSLTECLSTFGGGKSRPSQLEPFPILQDPDAASFSSGSSETDDYPTALRHLTLKHSQSTLHSRTKTSALSLPSTVLTSCPNLNSLTLSSQLSLNSVPTSGHLALRSLSLPSLPSANLLGLYNHFLPSLKTISFPTLPAITPSPSLSATSPPSPTSKSFSPVWPTFPQDLFTLTPTTNRTSAILESVRVADSHQIVLFELSEQRRLDAKRLEARLVGSLFDGWRQQVSSDDDDGSSGSKRKDGGEGSCGGGSGGSGWQSAASATSGGGGSGGDGWVYLQQAV